MFVLGRTNSCSTGIHVNKTCDDTDKEDSATESHFTMYSKTLINQTARNYKLKFKGSFEFTVNVVFSLAENFAKMLARHFMWG